MKTRRRKSTRMETVAAPGKTAHVPRRLEMIQRAAAVVVTEMAGTSHHTHEGTPAKSTAGTAIVIDRDLPVEQTRNPRTVSMMFRPSRADTGAVESEALVTGIVAATVTAIGKERKKRIANALPVGIALPHHPKMQSTPLPAVIVEINGRTTAGMPWRHHLPHPMTWDSRSKDPEVTTMQHPPLPLQAHPPLPHPPLRLPRAQRKIANGTVSRAVIDTPNATPITATKRAKSGKEAKIANESATAMALTRTDPLTRAAKARKVTPRFPRPRQLQQPPPSTLMLWSVRRATASACSKSSSAGNPLPRL